MVENPYQINQFKKYDIINVYFPYGERTYEVSFTRGDYVWFRDVGKVAKPGRKQYASYQSHAHFKQCRLLKREH